MVLSKMLLYFLVATLAAFYWGVKILVLARFVNLIKKSSGKEHLWNIVAILQVNLKLSTKQASLYSTCTVPRVPKCLSIVGIGSPPPTPSPASECVSPWTQRGGQHSIAREGVGGTQFRRLDRKRGTLWMYIIYCSYEPPACSSFILCHGKSTSTILGTYQKHHLHDT